VAHVREEFGFHFRQTERLVARFREFDPYLVLLRDVPTRVVSCHLAGEEGGGRSERCKPRWRGVSSHKKDMAKKSVREGGEGEREAGDGKRERGKRE
jgi:hypothetical protein